MRETAWSRWCNDLNFNYLRVGESFIFVLSIDRLPDSTAHELGTNDRTRSQIFYVTYPMFHIESNIESKIKYLREYCKFKQNITDNFLNFYRFFILRSLRIYITFSFNNKLVYNWL